MGATGLVAEVLLRLAKAGLRRDKLSRPTASLVTFSNPVHREFGRTFCRMDRTVPYGLAATQL